MGVVALQARGKESRVVSSQRDVRSISPGEDVVESPRLYLGLEVTARLLLRHRHASGPICLCPFKPSWCK